MLDEFKGIKMDMVVWDDCKEDSDDDLTIAYQLGYYDCKKDLAKSLEPILKEFRDDLENCYSSGETYVRIDSMYLERLLDILE